MPLSGSPTSGSYTYPQMVHTYFFIELDSFIIRCNWISASGYSIAEKEEQIKQIVAAVKEDLKNTKDTYSQHEPDQWSINYGEKVDITENYLSDDYESIGMKSAVLFRGVKLENKESGDTLVFLNENIPVIEFEDGWYYSMT